MQMVILEVLPLLFVNLLQVVEVVADQLVDNQLNQEVLVEAQVVVLLVPVLDQEMLEVLIHLKEIQEALLTLLEGQQMELLQAVEDLVQQEMTVLQWPLLLNQDLVVMERQIILQEVV
tara:strand:+ start:309 stop:662 length:354 start_codon:yes stop_codon:yes gene_type:complete